MIGSLLQARLDQFSAADAPRYGLSPAQVQAWRDVYEGDPGPSPRAATPSGAATASSREGQTGPARPAASPSGGAPSDGASADTHTPDIGPQDEPRSAAPAGHKAARQHAADDALPAFPSRATGQSGLLAAIRGAFPWTRTPEGKIVAGIIAAAAVGAAQQLWGYSHWTALIWPLVALPLVLWRKRKAAAADVTAGVSPAEADGSSPTPSAVGLLASVRARRLAALAAVAVVLIIGGFVWLRIRQHPSAAAVRGYLDQSFEPQPLRIAAIDLTSGSPSAAGTRVTFQAEVETTAPLYRRLVTADWLGQKAPTDATAILAADKLLRGPEAARLRALAGDPPSPAISDLVLLSTQTAAGTPSPYSGTLLGWRRDGTWVFTASAAALPAPKFAGEPRPAGVGVFAVDDPAELARLQRLVADHAAYAAKLQTASINLATELARERQDRLTTFARLLRPGTLFTGAHTAPLRETTEPVLIEVVSSTPETRRFDALLRNAGGWTDARHFDGQWSLTADADRANVILSTRSAQAVAHAGPLLEDLGDWNVSFELHADGTVVTVPGNHQLQLTRVDPDNAGSVQDHYRKSLTDALAATAVGRTYRAAGLVLRFTQQDPTAATVQAVVSSAADPAQGRTFHGSIVANTYRTAQWPIRLRSSDAERVKVAAQDTLLGHNTYNDGLVLELGLDGDRLTGNDGTHDYVFAVSTQQEAEAAAATVAAGVSVAVQAQQTQTQTASSAISHAGELPRAPGAYYLKDGTWTPLPHNHGHTVKNTGLNSALATLKAAEDKLAGQGAADDIPASSVLATIIYDGTDPIPTVSGTGLMIAYVGALKPMPDAILKNYPLLRDYPLVEMARTTTVDGHEEVRLIRIAPGIAAFGPTRIPATVESYGPLTLLRPAGPLAPGTYALTCGSEKYELRVTQ